MNLLSEIESRDKRKVRVTRVTRANEQAEKPCHTRAEPGYLSATFEGNHRVTNRVTKKISPSLLKAYKVARPWLLANLDELKAKGWTRRSLFKAERFAYPFGDWGVAWLKVWLRPGVKVSIEDDGGIAWTWLEAKDRRVTQRAYPFFK